MTGVFVEAVALHCQKVAVDAGLRMKQMIHFAAAVGRPLVRSNLSPSLLLHLALPLHLSMKQRMRAAAN
jgi:hypothetical protein